MSLAKRVISVQVAGLTLSAVRIAVRVSEDADGSQTKGVCLLYNLNPVHSDQIYERTGPIRVDAGYAGHVGQIFDGQVQRVQRSRSDLAHITRIRMGDQLRSTERLGGFTNRQYFGAVPTVDIVRDLISDMGFAPGPLTNIPASAFELDFGWVGPSDAGLTVVLARHSLTFYLDGGIVRVGGSRTRQPDATTLTLSPATGLVGTPTPTDEGLEVVSFLNPLIRLSTLLNIESESVTGRYKVVGLRIEADNWDGAFLTRCDTRPA